MKDIPGFYFYPKDWIANPHIIGMTDQQYRAYHLLLCAAWLNDPPATLPNDTALLAKLAGVSLEIWEQIQAPIIDRFKLNCENRYHHPKLTATYKEARKKYNSRAKAASIRWGKEKKKA